MCSHEHFAHIGLRIANNCSVAISFQAESVNRVEDLHERSRRYRKEAFSELGLVPGKREPEIDRGSFELLHVRAYLLRVVGTRPLC